MPAFGLKHAEAISCRTDGKAGLQALIQKETGADVNVETEVFEIVPGKALYIVRALGSGIIARTDCRDLQRDHVMAAHKLYVSKKAGMNEDDFKAWVEAKKGAVSKAMGGVEKVAEWQERFEHHGRDEVRRAHRERWLRTSRRKNS